MGPIVDRTEERFGPAGSGGIVTGPPEAAQGPVALRDEGDTPPGADPEHPRVRSAAVVQVESFLDSCRDAVEVTPGVRQATV
ncbi:hypothetical protein [Streptomyces carpinensis]|uniref:Uncharacterized protein n=1 Tax=Streptomyces carpinensis TaxID=66369 RepID=A0ABV1W6Y8_9ACTN|nr:hypothetical protein [Streptomyces carpinensis]